jgi:ElaA protein
MLTWRFERFENLTAHEVHDIYRARIEVFVIEQECPFQDIDGADPASWHLMGLSRSGSSPSALGEGRGVGQLVAYCRIIPPGVKYAEPSIGRVLTTAAIRGTGAGKVLMLEALRRTDALWPGRAVRIGAQMRLERFYNELGFVKSSEPYDEDGIVHIEMLLPRGES